MLRFVAPRRVEIQRVEVRPPAPGEVLVRTRWSGISGGTELLAYRGELDETLELDETIPVVGGHVPVPVRLRLQLRRRGRAVGRRRAGEGSTVFAFHPHQDLFTASAADVVAVEGLDGRVATLFPLVETALQVSLDAGPRIEEPVVVLGLGPVGVLTAAMLQRSGADVLGADPRARPPRDRVAVRDPRRRRLRDPARPWRRPRRARACRSWSTRPGAPAPCRSRSSSWRTKARRWSAAGSGPRTCGSRSAGPSTGAGSRSGAPRSRRSRRGWRGDGTSRAGGVRRCA